MPALNAGVKAAETCDLGQISHGDFLGKMVFDVGKNTFQLLGARTTPQLPVSIRIAPGIRMNLGLRSLSVSASVRGLKYTTGTRGRRVTVGLPGTGLFWTSNLPRGTGIRYAVI
jgi:hypothetical protein